MENTHSVAHKHDMNWVGARMYPDGRVPWAEAVAPDIASGRTTGRLCSCGYCGSMHPKDVAEAIRAGARGHFADRKYGWPHKAYFNDIPNPHAGMEEVRSSCYSDKKPSGDGWEEAREPQFDQRTGERLADRIYWIQRSIAGAKTWGKFYTVHLQDASPEDRETIEKHFGLRFEFTDGGSVSWKPV